jgi:hypothetical protein
MGGLLQQGYKIRVSLNKDKQKGIPFDNSRMMDELLQFHIITPNSEGKAIWNCELSGGGFKKAVNLTMLKVRLEKIYFKVKDEDKDYEDIFSGDNQATCLPVILAVAVAVVVVVVILSCHLNSLMNWR